MSLASRWPCPKTVALLGHSARGAGTQRIACCDSRQEAVDKAASRLGGLPFSFIRALVAEGVLQASHSIHHGQYFCDQRRSYISASLRLDGAACEEVTRSFKEEALEAALHRLDTPSDAQAWYPCAPWAAIEAGPFLDSGCMITDGPLACSCCNHRVDSLLAWGKAICSGMLPLVAPPERVLSASGRLCCRSTTLRCSLSSCVGGHPLRQGATCQGYSGQSAWLRLSAASLWAHALTWSRAAAQARPYL